MRRRGRVVSLSHWPLVLIEDDQSGEILRGDTRYRFARDTPVSFEVVLDDLGDRTAVEIEETWPAKKAA